MGQVQPHRLGNLYNLHIQHVATGTGSVSYIITADDVYTIRINATAIPLKNDGRPARSNYEIEYTGTGKWNFSFKIPWFREPTRSLNINLGAK